MDGGGMIVRRTSVFFGLGVLTALAAGWVAFPRVLYIRRAQPLVFPHKTHAAKSGTAACGECHGLRDDGGFAGLPATASCAGCHAGRMGSSPAEAVLVDRYVKSGRQVEWLVYARQPANVRFSHAIHTRRAGLQCRQCHGTQGESDEVRLHEQNRINGYSRGMKMSACESCHHERRIEAGCLGCHQ
jgi:menaquinone reductase, multiheme cytochrome c subunit